MFSFYAFLLLALLLLLFCQRNYLSDAVHDGMRVRMDDVLNNPTLHWDPHTDHIAKSTEFLFFNNSKLSRSDHACVALRYSDLAIFNLQFSDRVAPASI